MNLVLAIAAGGAIGALARHYFAAAVSQWLGSGFPFGILAANILGSFLMGLLVETAALVWSPSEQLRAFLAVGVLGAFTTFSTFSLDAVLLSSRGAFGLSLLYVGLSVVLAIAGLRGGMWLVRSLVG